MLKKIRKLLSGSHDVATLTDGMAEIDIAALESALAAAQQRRAAILLDGTVGDVLAAERAVDEARIELERGRVALAELDRRRAEAEAKAKRAELERQRADAQAKVDEAVSRIEAEYPGHAKAIAELCALAKAADDAAREWSVVAISEDPPEGLPAVDLVAKRLGWEAEFAAPPPFHNGPSLPPVADFHGIGEAARWKTHMLIYAALGGGIPPRSADQQMARGGPRWKAA